MKNHIQQESQGQQPQSQNPPIILRRNPSPVMEFLETAKYSLVSKLVVLGIIIIVLLFPYFLARNLMNERERRANAAEEEVSAKWGGRQLITAPVLSIPVQRTALVKGQEETRTSTLTILPETLTVESTIVPEIRARSIYQVILYKSQNKFTADIITPVKEMFGDWTPMAGGEAKLLFSVSDVKGIKNFDVKVNGETLRPRAGNIISLPVKLGTLGEGTTLKVEGEISLNGCRHLLFNPMGRNFKLNMTSPWAHPSFTGGFLPRERTISDKGFTASWEINELNSSFPQYWIGALKENIPLETPEGRSEKVMSGIKALGVSLVQPAGTYQQVERVSNYAFLVIAIVLVSFLIGEQLTKIWIHPLQYFFAGLSLVMFYVLLLALAEHISFNLSYVITTLVIAGMTTLYCRMIFVKKKSAALLLGGIMFLAYLLVFVLIRLEDYALLAGSLILLSLLGILMRATGHMNAEETAEP